MKIIKIAILDDNKNQVEEINRFCRLYFKKNNLTYEIKTYSDTTQFLNDNFSKVDILLLDIEMPKNSGIEIACKVRKFNKKCFICFITNYSDYIYESYDVHAFDYIMKPIDGNRLFKLFDEVIKYMHVQLTGEDKRFTFKTTNGNIILSKNQIMYFEYFDNFENKFKRITKVHTLSGTYNLKESISEIYGKLGEKEFVIPHRAYIVNLDYIKLFTNSGITMQNNTVIPLSQKRASVARKKFTDYIQTYYKE